MSHYLCSGAVTLLFIVLAVITVSPDLTVTHSLMMYPEKGFIWKQTNKQSAIITHNLTFYWKVLEMERKHHVMDLIRNYVGLFAR